MLVMSQSRTKKSIKNSVVALFFYAITLILNFFSRKIFLDYLGADILGLNTTALNLLQFLNLAELGISTAVGFTLYAPLRNDDKVTINEIVTLQGHLYRRIAYGIIIASLILMCFFPAIFRKITLPLWYAYASFGVLLFSALLGYFFNYKQILLSASQQDYKIQYSFKSVSLIKVLAQIFAIYYFQNGYVWWLILEAIFAVLGSITLGIMTRRTFPWLENSSVPFRHLRLKYNEFTTKIKQLFVHKIGSFALTQTSPLIIYAYTSLSLVALYGNYIILIHGVQQLISAIFNSLTAGVGNLVAEGNEAKIWNVFNELFSLRFFIAAVLCFTLYKTTPAFISLWIGQEYLLANSTLAILIVTLFINMSRYTVETFINAYGIYQDIFAPLLEAALNIGLSILFGYFFGLNGILSGVLVSLVVIVLLWKPYFLFTRAIQGKLKKYINIYGVHCFLLAIAWILATLIIDCLTVNPNLNWGCFTVYLGSATIIFSAIYCVFLIVFKCGIRSFFERLVKFSI